jgi:hypothetical protein
MKWVNFLILSVCLTSCATLTPPDVFVFKNLEPSLVIDESNNHVYLTPSAACMEAIQEAACGYGVSIVTGKKHFVGEHEKTWFNKKPWSQLKAESIYVPSEESYAPMSAYMINACKKMNCNSEITKFRVKFDSPTKENIDDKTSKPKATENDNNK